MNEFGIRFGASTSTCWIIQLERRWSDGQRGSTGIKELNISTDANTRDFKFAGVLYLLMFDHLKFSRSLLEKYKSIHPVFTHCSCVFQIVNLIEETGHFHITNTTFDFDLCSLDRSTVRKLQSYLETSGLSWGPEQLAVGSLTSLEWTLWTQCKSPHCGRVQLLCVSSLLVGLGSLNEEAVRLQRPEPGVRGMSPVDQEITRKALKISLDLKEKKNGEEWRQCCS